MLGNNKYQKHRDLTGSKNMTGTGQVKEPTVKSVDIPRQLTGSEVNNLRHRIYNRNESTVSNGNALSGPGINGIISNALNRGRVVEGNLTNPNFRYQPRNRNPHLNGNPLVPQLHQGGRFDPNTCFPWPTFQPSHNPVDIIQSAHIALPKPEEVSTGEIECILGLLKFRRDKNVFSYSENTYTIKTQLQKMLLVEVFRIEKYPGKNTRLNLSILTNLSLRRVQVYFQNLRMNMKKTQRGKKLLASFRKAGEIAVDRVYCVFIECIQRILMSTKVKQNFKM